MSVNYIPAGYETMSAHLICRDAAKAIEFYKEVFGAEELTRYADPLGHIACAELRIGSSIFALADENIEWKNLSPEHLGGSPVHMTIYVEDAHAVAAKAVAAGAEEIYPVQDHFYGERQGRFKDPSGHIWMITTHIEDVTPEVVAERMAQWVEENC
jgi:PhnB protein